MIALAGVDVIALSKKYLVAGEDFFALKQVSIAVPDGSFVVIVGKSGCGKTTLLRLIAGLEKQTAGEIVFSGTSPTSHNNRVGIMFQEHRLMPWLTVRENMAFGLDRSLVQAERDEWVDRHIHMLGLTGFDSLYPSQLSGGMAQRVALGRTLCFDPDVILMDEPFGALDYFTRKRLQKELAELFIQQKKTVIFVTHDVSEAVFLGQKIVILHAGEVLDELLIPADYPRDSTAAEIIGAQKEILRILGSN